MTDEVDTRPADQEQPERRSPARLLRWGLPVLLLVVWLAIGGLGGPIQGKLSEVQRNDNGAFLPTTAESTEVNQLQQKFQRAQSLPAVLIFERSTGLTTADRDAIAAKARQVAAADGVNGTVPPPIPSADHQAEQVVVPLDQDGAKLTDRVKHLRDIATGGLPAGLAAHVTGPAGIIGDFAAAFGGIDGLLLGVAALVVALILTVVYRSPILPVLVLLTAALALCAAVLVVYQLAKHDVLTLNGQSQGILFILVFGAATDYSLLLVSRFREELRSTASTWHALRTALRFSIEPIAASAGTVILGLLCLLLSDLTSTRGLGPVAAIGIAASLLAALTFLPATLALFGRAAFWPLRPKLGSQVHKETGPWARVSGVVGRRPRAIWLVTGLVLVAAAAFLPQFKAAGVAQSDLFLTTVDSVTGQQVLSRHFAGGTGSPVVIIARQDAAGPVLTAVRGTNGISAAVQASKPVDGLVEISATLRDPADSEAAVTTVRDLRTTVHAVPGAQALVGGQTAIQLDTQDTSTRDRSLIIPVVLAVVFVILALLLRALLAPLLLMLTVVLSFAATLGVSALVFNHLLHFPGADPSVPLFAFVFLVALGIDYNIFLMTRIREETLRHGTRSGALRGLAVTGGVITSAGVVLAATFGALAVIPVLFLAQIAFLVAFGVLLDTLLVRSLLVPALTVDIGRAVWWPSRLARTEPKQSGESGRDPGSTSSS
jgi:RND superfamily putative drug exporter